MHVFGRSLYNARVFIRLAHDRSVVNLSIARADLVIQLISSLQGSAGAKYPFLWEEAMSMKFMITNLLVKWDSISYRELLLIFHLYCCNDPQELD